MNFVLLINLFVLSIIVFSFINFNLSIALYVAYLILVPVLQMSIGGSMLSYNVINLLLLGTFLYHFFKRGNTKLSFAVVLPFLFLFFALLFISVFTSEIPWPWQFNYWRGDMMQTCILSFIVWNLVINNSKSIKYIKWALIVSITIAGVYGIVLTQWAGENPYISMLSDSFVLNNAAETYASFNDPRLDFSSAGKIQSTMIHPMTWSLILCFSLVVMIALWYKTKSKLLWPLIGLILFNMLISGVRTGIAAVALGGFYFLIRYRKFKLILASIALIAVAAIVINSNEDLSNLFASFTDVSGQNSDVSGSSIPMRINQFNGALKEMEGHELVGKGYEWSAYYQMLYGEHPVLLAFESLVFTVLCNSGIMGVLIWAAFFVMLFHVQRKIVKTKSSVYAMDAFVIIFLSYSIGTGEYGYLKFFSTFYAFLLGILRANENRLETEPGREENKEIISSEIMSRLYHRKRHVHYLN